MVVDSSALLAAVFRDPGHLILVDLPTSAELVAAGSHTLPETGIVLKARLGATARGMVERILAEFGIEEILFGEGHWTGAAEAFRQLLKGRHPAGLNFGDCLTYSAPRRAGEPLPCLGDDFPRTDLELVARA